MQNTLQIILCLFAVIGAIYIFRTIADYIWTKRLLHLLGSDNKTFPDSNAIDAVITVKLPANIGSSPENPSRSNDHFSLSDSDMEYLALYFDAMLCRTPLGELVSEIIFTNG